MGAIYVSRNPAMWVRLVDTPSLRWLIVIVTGVVVTPFVAIIIQAFLPANRQRKEHTERLENRFVMKGPRFH